MLRNRKYKNTLQLESHPDPTERRENLTKEILRNGTIFPKPLTYEDIDQAMNGWCNKVLDLSFEGKKVPTIALYTNQRFEEYIQEWESSDEKKNIQMNFKTLTRENNPKKGSINGDRSNTIPGDRFYTILREKVVDRNNQEYYVDYKMKQPFAVDFTYKIDLVTAKYELINKFNTLYQDIFKSGYSYLNVNGHYITIKPEDASDESEYAIDDRRYFSQSVKIVAKAYIIQEEDFKIEETPIVKCKFVTEGIEDVRISSEEDSESVVEEDGLYYKPLTLNVDFTKCDNNSVKTRIPYKMVVKKITTDNIKSFQLFMDGEEVNITKDFEFIEGALTKIKIRRENPMKPANIVMEGYDKDVIYDENDIDAENPSEEMNI